jgi:hypothetical protein
LPGARCNKSPFPTSAESSIANVARENAPGE